MTKEKTKVENPKQRKAFLIYFKLGGKRSLKKVCQAVAKNLPKTTKQDSLLVKIKNWSVNYKWQERIRAMDKEVYDKAEQIAIRDATMKKSDILKACQDTMKKYVEHLKSGKLVPTANDFRKMWEIARIELGKPIGQDALIGVQPSINIFLTKNEKVIKVVQESQNKLRDVLEGEIVEK